MAKNANRLFQEFNEYKEEHSLARELPYWDFTDDVMALADGTICQGLNIHGVSIETWDAERINRLTEGLRAFLNGLPDGVEFHILQRKTPTSTIPFQLMADFPVIDPKSNGYPRRDSIY